MVVLQTHHRHGWFGSGALWGTADNDSLVVCLIGEAYSNRPSDLAEAGHGHGVLAAEEVDDVRLLLRQTAVS